MGNQAAKPMAKTKKTSIQQKQKPNNTYQNNNNNNNKKTSTLSSSPPLSLFQKAAITRHAITDDNDMDGGSGNGNGNSNPTSTATSVSHKGIWDYYDKLEQIAQGSTCDIFTVTRKSTTTTATETATTSSPSSSKSKPTYVVKQMIKDRVSKAILDEMQAEIDILSTLDHPHVVRIYETFQDKHNFYIVMEHLKGGDLYSRRSQYTEPQVAKIMTQICSALVYCHENNVVHRDIKMEYETTQNDTKRNHPHI
jgi:Protein kinase domain